MRDLDNEIYSAVTGLNVDDVAALSAALSVDSKGAEDSPVAAAESLAGYLVDLSRSANDIEPLSSPPSIDWDEIHWRIDSKPSNVSGSDGRARYVSYISVRTMRRKLDAWVGAENWRSDYEEASLVGKPVLWCHLSIRVNGEWITRHDIGVPGKDNTGGVDADNTILKGLVTDATKRAGGQWGIGREVYDLPEVWAHCKVSTRERGGKTYQNAYPTDRALTEIQAELKKRGYDVAAIDKVRVEERSEADDPLPDEEAPDATNWLKQFIYDGVNQNSDEAALIFQGLQESFGVTPPLTKAQAQRMSVEAAKQMAAAEDPTG